MEYELAFEDIRVENFGVHSDFSALKINLMTRIGIENVSFHDGILHVDYIPYAISSNQIKEVVSENGCMIISETTGKKSIKKFIDRMGRNNRKTFGGSALNCCDLNKE